MSTLQAPLYSSITHRKEESKMEHDLRLTEKERLRKQLEEDVAQYLLDGGVITVLKPSPEKINRRVNSKEK